MTEPLEPRLREVWPQETKFQKRCFELLRAAYVKARYSRHYRITDEELAYLVERIELLRQIVTEASDARLKALRDAADGVAT
jgi:predicted transcriptional regulator